MSWLQRHSTAVLLSTFGISFLLMASCFALLYHYLFVSFVDGRDAHPKLVTESSIMIIGYFAVCNGMITFRLLGHRTKSYLLHSITQQTVTLLIVLQIGFFFSPERVKLFYLTFPLPALTMVTCFLMENIFALYVSICTPGTVKEIAHKLHTGIHAFLGVTSLIIMFWNVTLMLAMMCVNPKHVMSISDIEYKELLIEPGYMAILVSFYLLLILFILLIPFLRFRREAKDATYEARDSETYTLSKKVLKARASSDEEDGDTTQGEETNDDADDEKDQVDVENERRSSVRPKTFVHRLSLMLDEKVIKNVNFNSSNK